MTPDEAVAFARNNHRAVLMTTRADGKTQSSPVVVGVGSDDRIVVSTRETAMKYKNLKARPWAAVCIFTEAFFGPWVQIEGPCEIESLPSAMEHLVEYYRQVSGEHPNWDEYRQAMTRDRRVLLHLTVERVSPSISG